jgi:hypothetical protein
MEIKSQKLRASVCVVEGEEKTSLRRAELILQVSEISSEKPAFDVKGFPARSSTNQHTERRCCRIYISRFRFKPNPIFDRRALASVLVGRRSLSLLVGSLWST